MDFKEVLRRRHCTRKFLDKQIKDEVIFEILNEARNAPSWVNAQERKVYVATKEVAKKIRAEYLEQARKGLIGVSDFSFTKRSEWSEQAQKNMREFSKKIEDLMGENYGDFIKVQDTFFSAPTMIFLTLPKKASCWAILDLGAFEMAILMSATAHDLETMVAYAFVKYPEILRKHLQIPEDEDIVIGIGIGHADENSKINEYRSSRTPLNQMMNLKE